MITEQTLINAAQIIRRTRKLTKKIKPEHCGLYFKCNDEGEITEIESPEFEGRYQDITQEYDFFMGFDLIYELYK